jgi:hypothetical protein
VIGSARFQILEVRSTVRTPGRLIQSRYGARQLKCRAPAMLIAVFSAHFTVLYLCHPSAMIEER